MGKIYRDGIIYAGGGNIKECTQAQYDEWKANGQLVKGVTYDITDAPNLNGTADDLSYSGGATSTYDEVESLKSKEFYKVRTTQVVIPSKTCTANTSNQLLNGVDIKTLTYDALDNISGFSETLIGAVFLWSNGGVAFATDTLVMDGKLTLYVCPNASSIITKIRLLTFWR